MLYALVWRVQPCAHNSSTAARMQPVSSELIGGLNVGCVQRAEDAMSVGYHEVLVHPLSFHPAVKFRRALTCVQGCWNATDAGLVGFCDNSLRSTMRRAAYNAVFTIPSTPRTMGATAAEIPEHELPAPD
jgi:hypothetical protein